MENKMRETYQKEMEKNAYGNIVVERSAFTIHTFEFKVNFPSSCFSSAFDVLSKAGQLYRDLENYKENDYVYHVRDSKYIGVRMTLRRLQTGPMQDGTYGYKNSIKLIVTPQTIIQHETGERICLADLFNPTEENCIIIKTYIERMVKELGMARLHDTFRNKYEDILPDGFESFLITRIDYAVDIKFNAPLLVTKYLKLIRKAFYSSTMKPYIYYDDIGHRTKAPSNTVKYWAATMAFTVYDKCTQLMKSGLGDADTLEAAAGILRFEANCFRGKVDYIKNRLVVADRLNMNLELLKNSQEISKSQFRRLIPSIFFMGDYVSKNYLDCYIYHLRKEKQITKRQAANILNFIMQVDKLGSVIPVGNMYKKKSYQRLVTVRSLLDECNINPVLAQKSIYKTLHTDTLPSIPRLMGFLDEQEDFL